MSPPTHQYEVEVRWTGNLGEGTAGYRAYSRDHEVFADGPPAIAASSEPGLRGDPERWNPEQLLVAALSQCHMLWYLHLCATEGVVVIDYTDRAHGEMAMAADGGGEFTEVILRPVVTVEDEAMVAKATELHGRANELCFIARSVAFPVRHEPKVTASVPEGLA